MIPPGAFLELREIAICANRAASRCLPLMVELPAMSGLRQVRGEVPPACMSEIVLPHRFRLLFAHGRRAGIHDKNEAVRSDLLCL